MRSANWRIVLALAWVLGIAAGGSAMAEPKSNPGKKAGKHAHSCSDGRRNQSESDVDCGGATVCARCGVGQTCTAGSDCLGGVCVDGRCKCGDREFTFTLNSNQGGYGDSAEWPGGTQTQTWSPGCSVTIVNPNDNVELVCTLAQPFSVKGFTGFSACTGTGGEDGDGCESLTCPPAGIGSCCSTRPSCTAGLNGNASARYRVVCRP